MCQVSSHRSTLPWMPSHPPKMATAEVVPASSTRNYSTSWKVSDTQASDTPKMYASSCRSHTPEPDPQTGQHKQLVFKGHHCKPTSTSHVLPAFSSFAEHIWLRIFSFNSIPNAFERAQWTTDRVNPEMYASANRRFLSRSQKRICESATFELAFSHSRRQVDAPFLPRVSCIPRSAFLLPQALRGLVSPSDWAAVAAAPATAMASCFFSLISRAQARRLISPQWGVKRWLRQDQWFGEKVETGSRRFRTTDWSFSVSLQRFCILFCMRSVLATAWQPRACPLANSDNNR